MSEVKQRCQMADCNRAASTRCFCCNQNVCTRHFTEHIDVVKAQIDPLTNDINSMVEKIQTLTVEQLTDSSFAQLHQWKDDMHRLVDEIFLAKSKEMEEMIEKNTVQFLEHKREQSETMMKVQNEVRQLVEDGDATHEQIQLLRKRLSDVEAKLATFRNNFVCVNTRVLAEGLVTVSSNLSKPTRAPRQSKKIAPTNPPPSTQTNTVPSFYSPTLNSTDNNSIFGRTPQASAGTSFGAFGVNQPQATTATLFSSPPSSSLYSNAVFGGTPQATSAFAFGASVANQPQPVTSSPFPFGFGSPNASASNVQPGNLQTRLNPQAAPFGISSGARSAAKK